MSAELRSTVVLIFVACFVLLLAGGIFHDPPIRVEIKWSNSGCWGNFLECVPTCPGGTALIVLSKKCSYGVNMKVLVHELVHVILYKHWDPQWSNETLVEALTYVYMSKVDKMLAVNMALDECLSGTLYQEIADLNMVSKYFIKALRCLDKFNFTCYDYYMWYAELFLNASIQDIYTIDPYTRGACYFLTGKVCREHQYECYLILHSRLIANYVHWLETKLKQK